MEEKGEAEIERQRKREEGRVVFFASVSFRPWSRFCGIQELWLGFSEFRCDLGNVRGF